MDPEKKKIIQERGDTGMVKKTISKTTHRAWVSMTQLLDYFALSSRFHGPLGTYMSHAAAWLLQVWRAEIEVQCSIYHFLCSMGVGASSGGMVLVIKRLGFMWVIVHGMQYFLTSYIPMYLCSRYLPILFDSCGQIPHAWMLWIFNMVMPLEHIVELITPVWKAIPTSQMFGVTGSIQFFFLRLL